MVIRPHQRPPNPRSPSPDMELGELSESEETAPEDLTPEYSRNERICGLHTGSISRLDRGLQPLRSSSEPMIWFVVLPASSKALEELKKGLIDGQGANVLHLAEVWVSTRT